MATVEVERKTRDPRLPFADESQMLVTLESHELITPRVTKAVEQAKRSHEHQRRTNGNTYLEEHIWPGVESLLNSGLDPFWKEDVIVCWLLHDTVEDDPNFTKEDLIRDFGPKMWEFMDPVTKSPAENSSDLSEARKYEIDRIVWGERVMNSHYVSRMAKLEDHLNNLACFIGLPDSPKKKRYVYRTEEFVLVVAAITSEVYYQRISQKLAEIKTNSR